MMAGHNESITINPNISTDSQDFIPFNSPPQAGFNPGNFSSPVKNNINYRKKQWKQNYNSPFNQQNNKSNRYSGPYNKSFNNSGNKKNHFENSQDISSFIHPSFTENPWEKLERDLKRKSSG